VANLHQHLPMMPPHIFTSFYFKRLEFLSSTAFLLLSISHVSTRNSQIIIVGHMFDK
jgi:hypothetical protein